MNHQKIIYLKTRHIFESCNRYLKPEPFRKSKFTLSKVKSESKLFQKVVEVVKVVVKVVSKFYL